MVIPKTAVPPPLVERSESNAKIYRHQAPTAPLPPAFSATPFLKQISSHIDLTIGPASRVFHEMVSTSVHLDMHLVPPTNQPATPEHPFGTSHYTIVTSGISSRPMNVPENYPGPKFIELMIALPPDWKGLNADGTFNQRVMKHERYWWPFRWLKKIARMPAELNTYLGIGHTIPNGEQAVPFAANTRLGCMMISPPLMSPESVKLIVNDHVTIYFLALMPLYPEEMQLKLKSGLQSLNDRLDAANLSELIQINRPGVAANM
jgi:Suppressor of fused protein (SUFU)